MERDKHSFLLCPILLSCPVMNKICLNQLTLTTQLSIHLIFIVFMLLLAISVSLRLSLTLAECRYPVSGLPKCSEGKDSYHCQ